MSDIHRGHCFCKAISWQVVGSPIRSVYCHCTLCQRLHASPFIHTIHYPADHFKWTHAEPHADHFEKYPVLDKPWKSRIRCRHCGVMVGSESTKTNNYSVYGAVLERDEEGQIKSWEQLKPTAHMFYGTRYLDVNDGLPKWEGYEEQSRLFSAQG
ncbi:Mss4-like protein [Pterulicium gracile]|uniref:Mss4-like protein n=1 Tax=Pterulicium gracile TaxID=1884261 RepID=A0A5C3QPP8_9AGAR|nr:Mss4-like protein [Pterula gracilis]